MHVVKYIYVISHDKIFCHEQF